MFVARTIMRNHRVSVRRFKRCATDYRMLASNTIGSFVASERWQWSTIGNVTSQWHAQTLKQSACACRRHETDVGSSEVQIANCTARIEHITKHLQRNKKDFASQRGLIAILNRRKKLMKYLYSRDKRAFARCVRELKIRNPIKGAVIKEDLAKLPGAEPAEALPEGVQLEAAAA